MGLAFGMILMITVGISTTLAVFAVILHKSAQRKGSMIARVFSIILGIMFVISVAANILIVIEMVNFIKEWPY